MRTIEEIKKLAEELIPYEPYRDTLFPGQRSARIEGFIQGYLKSIEDFESKIKPQK
jgi:hypothetical protein